MDYIYCIICYSFSENILHRSYVGEYIWAHNESASRKVAHRPLATTSNFSS